MAPSKTIGGTAGLECARLLLAADSRAEGAAAEAKTAALDAARRAAELAEVVPALKEAQAEPPPFPVLTGQVSSLPQY